MTEPMNILLRNANEMIELLKGQVEHHKKMRRNELQAKDAEIEKLKAEVERAVKELQEKCDDYPFTQNTLTEAVHAIICTLTDTDWACDDLRTALKEKEEELQSMYSNHTPEWKSATFQKIKGLEAKLAEAERLRRECHNCPKGQDEQAIKELCEGLRNLLESEVYADGEGCIQVRNGGCDDKEHRKITVKADELLAKYEVKENGN